MIKWLRFGISFWVILALHSCGGGGGGASDPLPSTATITTYMSAAFASDQLTLASDVQTVSRRLLSQGYQCSSNMIIAVTDVKLIHVQAFLNAVIANVQLVKTNNPIDKTAITALFATYQSQDVAWITSSASTLGNCGYTPSMISATGYATAVNTWYALAIAQLNSI